jgi:hypothetical protein
MLLAIFIEPLPRGWFRQWIRHVDPRDWGEEAGAHRQMARQEDFVIYAGF